MRKRIVVVVNKWWECDPIVAVLLNDTARPAKILGWPALNGHPRPRPNQSQLPRLDPSPKPRAIFSLPASDAEVWCVSDLLEHLPDTNQYQSSTERKAERLPLVFQGAAPDLTVAVGTAAFPGPFPNNGSVAVGTKVFMTNVHANGTNPDSNWSVGPFGSVIDSTLDPNVFARITTLETGLRPSVTNLFIPPALNPAPRPAPAADYKGVALSYANVTNYADYETADTQTAAAFSALKSPFPIGSVETTHGVIRASGGNRFLFVSGITDRVGHFADDVGPRSYAQNTVAAHNAGVVVAWMLPLIDQLV